MKKVTVANIELQLNGGKTGKNTLRQRTRSLLVFASSRSIQTTQRYIDGDSDAQRSWWR
jgi:hypothetical protein